MSVVKLEPENVVKFRQEDKVGIIEIDYAATLNSICKVVRTELAEQLQIAENTDIKVLIIKGIPRSFSSGGDLSEIGQLKNPVEAKEYVKECNEIIRLVYNSQKATIALVEGYCMGAGLSLAMACDLIYAGDKAKFSLPFLNVGLVPDCGATYFLTRLIGVQKAKELAYTRKMIDAAEARDIGLITGLFPADKVADEVKAISRQIASGPSKALAATKLNFELACRSDLESILILEKNAQAVCILGDEHIEGRTAFFEKRKPEF